jgi:hypothetical protein
MKTDGNEPIYPEKEWANIPTFGLTKREYFAAQALIGICANPNINLNRIDSAFNAVRVADFLISKLNGEK